MTAETDEQPIGEWLRVGDTIYCLKRRRGRSGRMEAVNSWWAPFSRDRETLPEELEGVIRMAMAAPDLLAALMRLHAATKGNADTHDQCGCCSCEASAAIAMALGLPIDRPAANAKATGTPQEVPDAPPKTPAWLRNAEIEGRLHPGGEQF